MSNVLMNEQLLFLLSQKLFIKSKDLMSTEKLSRHYPHKNRSLHLLNHREDEMLWLEGLLLLVV